MIHNTEPQLWGNNTSGTFVYDGQNSHRLPAWFHLVQPKINPEMKHIFRQMTNHSRNVYVYNQQSSRPPQGSAQNFPLVVEGV